jgi:tight adherence protein B
MVPLVATIAAMVAVGAAIAAVADATVVAASGVGTAGRSGTVSRGSVSPALVSVGSTLLGAAIGSVLAGPIGVVILGGAGAVVPSAVRRRRKAKHAEAVEAQLLDLVVSLAAALRAGRSLDQAVEAAGGEVASPIGQSIVAVSDRVALGTTLDASLHAWAAEIATPESRLIAGVLGLQRRTGGALAGPLDELAVTLRARRAAARELRSLTAQARLSAGILGLLPIGFFLFLSTVSRHDIEAAIATSAGASAVTLGVLLQGGAFLWIRSLLRMGER